MKRLIPLLVVTMLLVTSCLDIEEEPLLMIFPIAEISAHIRDQKIYATALVNVNPQVLATGNIPMIFNFTGELAIYDTENGNVIDANTFTGSGLSQVYTVMADTATHSRFVVVVEGNVNAYADIGSDGDKTKNKLLSGGKFYNEKQFIVSDLIDQSQ